MICFDVTPLPASLDPRRVRGPGQEVRSQFGNQTAIAPSPAAALEFSHRELHGITGRVITPTKFLKEHLIPTEKSACEQGYHHAETNKRDVSTYRSA